MSAPYRTTEQRVQSAVNWARRGSEPVEKLRSLKLTVLDIAQHVQDPNTAQALERHVDEIISPAIVLAGTYVIT